MSNFQRREFLTGAAAFAATTTATLAGTGRAIAEDQPPVPVRGKEGALIIGPTNPAREAQNLDRLAPPPTDHGAYELMKAHLNIDKSVVAQVSTYKTPVVPA